MSVLIATQQVGQLIVGVPDNDALVLVATQEIATLIIGAEQGPAGPPGGGAADIQFPAAATQWVVNHNLGFKPTITVFSTGGAEVEADIRHISINQAHVNFDSAFAGSVRCT